MTVHNLSKVLVDIVSGGINMKQVKILVEEN